AEGAGPNFVLCTTSLQTRACVRFSRPYIADFNLGMLPDPDIRLSVAVGASSAFPPLLSPVILKTDPKRWKDGGRRVLPDAGHLRSRLVLTDGGVYDNIGLEPLKKCETVLIADAGAPATIVRRPWKNWIGQLVRAREIMMEQTRALRRRHVVEELIARRRRGA